MTTARRILEVSLSDPDLSLGGLEAVVRELTRDLIQIGADVTWLFVLEHGPLKCAAHVDKVAMKFPFRPLKFLKPIRKLALSLFTVAHLLRHGSRYDLVHINGDNGGLASILCRVPVLVTLHGSSRESLRASLSVAQGYRKKLELTLASIIPRLLENVAVRNAASVVTVSRLLAFQYARPLGRSDAVVIYPGVDTHFFHPVAEKSRLRARLDLPSDVPLALWVGTTTFRKGFDSAVEAVEATRSFHLVVVGSSPSVKSNRVHVLGWLESRERLRDVFSACDAAIVTSYYEGFSVSVLEAMASGLALIVRNDSPVLETVPHENLLVVDTEAGFAAALSKLEGNLHLMKQLGLAARRCSEQFDVSVMTSRYRTIFENLVGSPGDVP